MSGKQEVILNGGVHEVVARYSSAELARCTARRMGLHYTRLNEEYKPWAVVRPKEPMHR